MRTIIMICWLMGSIISINLTHNDVMGVQSLDYFIEGTIYFDTNMNKVFDIGESPLSNAIVFVDYPEGLSTVSSIFGHYSCPVSIGYHTLVVRKPGWKTITKSINVSDSVTVNIGLIPFESIIGRVTDIKGYGVEGIHVEVYDNIMCHMPMFDTMTDGYGNYVIHGLPSGIYNLRIHKAEYFEQWKYCVEVDGLVILGLEYNWHTTTDINFVDLTYDFGTIFGTVIGGLGGLPGATVEVPGLGLSTTTGASGNYTIQGVPAGWYYIVAKKDGWIIGVEFVCVLDGSHGPTGPITFALYVPTDHYPIIEGIVTDGSQAIENAIVEIPYLNWVDETGLGVYTDKAGYYIFADYHSSSTYYGHMVLPGSYAIVVRNEAGDTTNESDNHHKTSSKTVVAQMSRVTRADFILEENYGVKTGRVIDENGIGVSGAVVSIPNSPFMTTCDSDGFFDLISIPSRTYSENCDSVILPYQTASGFDEMRYCGMVDFFQLSVGIPLPQPWSGNPHRMHKTRYLIMVEKGNNASTSEYYIPAPGNSSETCINSIILLAHQSDVIINDISFSNDNPEVGDQISIYVVLENHGATPKSINLEIFDGHPAEENMIGERSLIIPALQQCSIRQGWIPMGGGTHSIYAVLPETNQVCSKSIEIGEGKILQVPYFSQDGAQWCYLTSLAMVLQYYGNHVHPWDIAEYWNLGREDGIHSLQEIMLNQTDAYVANFGLNADVSHFLEHFSFDYYKDNIDNGKPVIFAATSIDLENFPIAGHAVVIVGYSEEDAGKYLYIHDPGGYFVTKWGIQENYIDGKGVYQYCKVSYDIFSNFMLLAVQSFGVLISGQEPSSPEGTILLKPYGIKYGNKQEINYGAFVWNNGLILDESQEYIEGDIILYVKVYNHQPTLQKYEVSFEITSPEGKTAKKKKVEVGSYMDNNKGFGEISEIFSSNEFLRGNGKYLLYLKLWKQGADYLVDQPCDVIGPIEFRVAANGKSFYRKKIFENVDVSPVGGGPVWNVDLHANFWAYLHKYNMNTPNEKWSFSLYVDSYMYYEGHQLHYDDIGRGIYLDYRIDVFAAGCEEHLISFDWISTDIDEDLVFGDPSKYGGWWQSICDEFFWSPNEKYYSYLRFEVTFRFTFWPTELPVSLYSEVEIILPISQKVELRCPADLHIYDFEGNHVGALYSESGDVVGIEMAIHGATYNGHEEEPEIITLPLDTDYIIRVFGQDEGEYTLGITKANPDGTIFEKQVSHTILPGQSFWYSTNLVLLKRNVGFNEQRIFNWLMRPLAFYSLNTAESLKEQACQLLQEAMEKNLDVSRIQALIEKADELLLDAKEQYLFRNYIAANILALEAVNLYQEALDILADLLS